MLPIFHSFLALLSCVKLQAEMGQISVALSKVILLRGDDIIG